MGNDPLGELFLDDQDSLLEGFPPLENPLQRRSGDLVGEVADDLEARGKEVGQILFEKVSLKQGETREHLPEPFGQLRVDLESRQVGGAVQDKPCQDPFTRADLQNIILRSDRNEVDDFFSQPPVPEEMLAPFSSSHRSTDEGAQVEGLLPVGTDREKGDRDLQLLFQKGDILLQCFRERISVSQA